jgi:hypothetical protein
MMLKEVAILTDAQIATWKQKTCEKARLLTPSEAQCLNN